MAGTVPCPFGRVPADDTPHVRADSRAERQLPGAVAIRRDLLSLELDDLAFPAPNGAKRAGVGPRKAVANHVVRIVDVLLEVVPRAAAEGLSTRIEELRPGILSLEDGVRHHHA